MKINENKKYEFVKDLVTKKYTPVSEKYIQLITDIKELKSTRDSIINRHFYELYNYNIDDLEDRDGKITRILGKPFSYPNSFLASSLGFTRTTWTKKYEEILNKFDITRKPKYQTLRNMLLFEKLKALIVKYYESKKKDKHIFY